MIIRGYIYHFQDRSCLRIKSIKRRSKAEWQSFGTSSSFGLYGYNSKWFSLFCPNWFNLSFYYKQIKMTDTILSTTELLNSLLNIVIFRNPEFEDEFVKITTSCIKSYFLSFFFKISQMSNSDSKLEFCSYRSDISTGCITKIFKICNTWLHIY